MSLSADGPELLPPSLHVGRASGAIPAFALWCSQAFALCLSVQLFSSQLSLCRSDTNVFLWAFQGSVVICVCFILRFFVALVLSGLVCLWHILSFCSTFHDLVGCSRSISPFCAEQNILPLSAPSQSLSFYCLLFLFSSHQLPAQTTY